MEELLDGRLAPITYTIGFLECNIARAVEAYLTWQRPVQEKRGVELLASNVNGNLRQILLHLLPLTSVERRRFLFLPTGGPWTAFFDNGHQSTDAVAPMSYLARTLGCRALRTTYIPDNVTTGRFGSRILEIYGPRRTDFLNYIRTISLGFDGRKWIFSAVGEVQPFEQTEQYTARLVQNKFTPLMLATYLNALGVRAFAEDFYPSDTAVLIYKQGPIAPAAKEFGLSNLKD
jgi:hypothetical protein